MICAMLNNFNADSSSLYSWYNLVATKFNSTEMSLVNFFSSLDMESLPDSFSLYRLNPISVINSLAILLSFSSKEMFVSK